MRAALATPSQSCPHPPRGARRPLPQAGEVKGRSPRHSHERIRDATSPQMDRHRISCSSSSSRASLLFWLLDTESGARFALARAVAAMEGKFSFERSSGRLAGPLTLVNVRYNDATSGVDARVGSIVVDLAPIAFLSKRVHIVSLEVERADIALTTVPPKPAEPASEFSLVAPVDVLLDRFSLRKATITQDGQPRIRRRQPRSRRRVDARRRADQHAESACAGRQRRSARHDLVRARLSRQRRDDVPLESRRSRHRRHAESGRRRQAGETRSRAQRADAGDDRSNTHAVARISVDREDHACRASIRNACSRIRR